jgi:hypothetical protein
MTLGPGLSCCGGHGQPPLCPSDRKKSPGKREEQRLTERTGSLPHSDPRTRNYWCVDTPGFPRLGLHASSAIPRRQRRTARLPPSPRARWAPSGRFPRSRLTGRRGPRPALPRGHRRLPQHGMRPPPPGSRNGRTRRSRSRTGTEHPNGTAASFRPLPSLGAANTDSSRTPLCLGPAPGPRAADRCSIVPHSTTPLVSDWPSKSPDRYGARR